MFISYVTYVTKNVLYVNRSWVLYYKHKKYLGLFINIAIYCSSPEVTRVTTDLGSKCVALADRESVSMSLVTCSEITSYWCCWCLKVRFSCLSFLAVQIPSSLQRWRKTAFSSFTVSFAATDLIEVNAKWVYIKGWNVCNGFISGKGNNFWRI